jgi:hypothetical protein
LVETAHADAPFGGDRCGREQVGTGLGQEVADQGRGDTVSELVSELTFFIAPR